MNSKILLSTDIGSDIDDALALDIMINAGFNLKGIYTVNGDVQSRAFITKHMINLANFKATVAIGESRPLLEGIDPYHYFEDAYVDDSFVDELDRDVVFKKPAKVGIVENGVEDMVKKLSKQKYTIFSIAPLTNIARVIEKYPLLISNIEHLYIMGCNFEHHEHNIRFDVGAAVKVFESEIPVTVIPSELCHGYRMPTKFLNQLQSPMGKYVRKMADGFIGAKTVENLIHCQLKDLPMQPFILDFIANLPLLEVSKKEDNIDIYTSVDRICANLGDILYASYQSEDFFYNFKRIINLLQSSDRNFGNGLAFILQEQILKDISVADVYVPYCYMYPDKIKTEKSTVVIDYNGMSSKTEGNKHIIVKEIDYSHFENFIKNYLY